MKKRLISILLVATLLLGCFTTVSFGASKTKKMTDYYEVIKSGKYAYCAAGSCLYKVNLKTKSKKKLAKIPAYVTDMKLYKGYIYFKGAEATGSSLYRVTKNGKGLKRLGTIDDHYAISGNRIYYEVYIEQWDDDYEIDYSYTCTYSMKLNGTDKRKDNSYKVIESHKRSNKKGYKINSVRKGDVQYKFYLKIPSGKKIYVHKENLWT